MSVLHSVAIRLARGVVTGLRAPRMSRCAAGPERGGYSGPLLENRARPPPLVWTSRALHGSQPGDAGQGLRAVVSGHQELPPGPDRGAPRQREPALPKLGSPRTGGVPRQGGSATGAPATRGSTPARRACGMPGAGSLEHRPASAPRPWERRGCGAADHWRRSTAAATAVGAGDRGSAQAAPAPPLPGQPARPSARRASSRLAPQSRPCRCSLQVGVLAAEGPTEPTRRCPRRGWGHCARLKGRGLRARAGGQPCFGPSRHPRSPGAPLAGSPGRQGGWRAAGPVQPGSEVGGGVWVTVPARRLPSPSLSGNSTARLAAAFLRAAGHPRSPRLLGIGAGLGGRTDVIVSGEPNPRG